MCTSSSLSLLSLSLSVSDLFLLLPAKQSSSNSTPSCNMYFATIAENCCGRDASGGGGSGGGFSSLYTGFCVLALQVS